MAETSYAPCGDLSLAYQVFGDGPVDLVYAGSFVSHIELAWTLPEYEAFMEQLATFCRVLVFDKVDKAGVGLSDPVPQVRNLPRCRTSPTTSPARGSWKSTALTMRPGSPSPTRS